VEWFNAVRADIPEFKFELCNFEQDVKSVITRRWYQQRLQPIGALEAAPAAGVPGELCVVGGGRECARPQSPRYGPARTPLQSNKSAEEKRQSKPDDDTDSIQDSNLKILHEPEDT
jgi:hypothetical protein